MRKSLRLVVIGCIVCMTYNTFATSHLIDSLQVSFHRRANLTGGFSTKNTFVNNFNAPVFTAKLGVDFGHRVRLGGGVASLKLPAFDSASNQKPFYIRNYYTDTLGRSRVQPASLEFTYLAYYFEYVFFKTNRWEVSALLQFGLGHSRYKYFNPNLNKSTFIHKAHIILYEPTISCYFKVVPWFGLGADVGFRFMVKNNKYVGRGFNSPIYDLKAIIFWTDLYCVLFPKTKLAQKWSN